MKLKRRLDSLFNQYFGKHVKMEINNYEACDGIVCGYNTGNNSLIISPFNNNGWDYGHKWDGDFIHKDYIGSDRTYYNTKANSKIVLL